MFKMDGWKNILSGLGGVQDKNRGNDIAVTEILDDQRLSEIWLGSGMTKKAISIFTGDMIRPGWDFNDDTEGLINKELKKLDFVKSLTTALNWQKLYRGSIIFMGINDGGNSDTPLSSSGGEIKYLKVFAANQINVMQTDIVTDRNSEYFGEVELFTVNDDRGNQFKIHASRCLIFKNEATPPETSIDWEYKYWGMSSVQSWWDEISQFSVIRQGVSNFMQEFDVMIYKLSNLKEILAKPDGEEKVRKRLEIINYSKSVIRGTVVDENESVESLSRNLSGIDKMLEKYMTFFSGVVGIPNSRFWGVSPAGLNSNGDNDLRVYYDGVDAMKEVDLEGPLMKIGSLINQQINAVPADIIEVKFNPTWTPTEKELIEMAEKQANTDEKYRNMQVLGSSEIREQRFVGEQSFRTIVESDNISEEDDGSET